LSNLSNSVTLHDEIIQKNVGSVVYEKAAAVLRLARGIEEIAQQGRSFGSQDRLGMKLDSLHIELPMLHAHDQAFVIGRRDFQTIRQGGAIDDQGMVASCCKGLGEVGVQARSLMVDSGDFSVHRLRRAAYFGAKGFADDLMAEADSKDGQLSGEVYDDFLADPGVVGRAGAGRDNNGVIVSGRNFIQGDLVVAHDLQRMA